MSLSWSQGCDRGRSHNLWDGFWLMVVVTEVWVGDGGSKRGIILLSCLVRQNYREAEAPPLRWIMVIVDMVIFYVPKDFLVLGFGASDSIPNWDSLPTSCRLSERKESLDSEVFWVRFPVFPSQWCHQFFLPWFQAHQQWSHFMAGLSRGDEVICHQWFAPLPLLLNMFSMPWDSIITWWSFDQSHHRDSLTLQFDMGKP